MKKISVIPAGATLVGDIEGDGDLVVLGRVDGPIHVAGVLVIEGCGQVRGHVRARVVTVRGVLKGDAYGERVVRVEETARLVGELTAPRVQVAVGARFRGQVHMGEVGDPRLAAYDPTMHTFSGAPAPTMEAPPADEGPTLPGAIAPEVPSPSDDGLTLSKAHAPSAARLGQAVEGPLPEFAAGVEAPRRAFRMPRLGRVRGERRGGN